MNFVTLTWLCWGAFGCTWIIGAIYNTFKGPEVVQKNDPVFWRYRIIGIVAAIVIYRVIERFVPKHIWTKIHFDVPWVNIVGAILLIACTLFTIWSRKELGKMWSSSVTLKAGHQLRTDGPYRIVRHPIYSGILGMMIGSILTVGLHFVAILAITFLLFRNKIRNEEQVMIDKFGDQYLEYKKRVPQLIPRLFKKLQ